MRRWQYAVACAAVAAIMLVGSGSLAQAVVGCERIREIPPTLHHGTAALGFTHHGQTRDSWHFPDGPAWLGTDPEFSVHAAMRLAQGTGQVTVFAYSQSREPSERRALDLVSCGTPEQAANYAVRHRRLRTADRGNDGIVAAHFCSVDYGLLDGYRIAADRVRGQIEYIICTPRNVFPVRRITYSFWSVTNFQLRNGVRGRLATPGPDGQARYFLADRDVGRGIDLTCFVRLPQTDEGSCSAPTKPRIACCLPPPRPPPRGQR